MLNQVQGPSEHRALYDSSGCTSMKLALLVEDEETLKLNLGGDVTGFHFRTITIPAEHRMGWQGEKLLTTKA